MEKDIIPEVSTIAMHRNPKKKHLLTREMEALSIAIFLVIELLIFFLFKNSLKILLCTFALRNKAMLAYIINSVKRYGWNFCEKQYMTFYFFNFVKKKKKSSLKIVSKIFVKRKKENWWGHVLITVSQSQNFFSFSRK